MCRGYICVLFLFYFVCGFFADICSCLSLISGYTILLSFPELSLPYSRCLWFAWGGHTTQARPIRVRQFFWTRWLVHVTQVEPVRVLSSGPEVEAGWEGVPPSASEGAKGHTSLQLCLAWCGESLPKRRFSLKKAEPRNGEPHVRFSKRYVTKLGCRSSGSSL